MGKNKKSECCPIRSNASIVSGYCAISPAKVGLQLRYRKRLTPKPSFTVYRVNIIFQRVGILLFETVICLGVIQGISQHGSVSDVHVLTNASLAISFYQSETVGPSVREDVKSEMLGLLQESRNLNIDTDAPPEHKRKIFDSETAAGRVDAVISERLRPGVNADGGDLELVELTDDGVAVIKLVGACNGCPSSDATLKHAIEKTLLHFCSGDVTGVRQAPSDVETIDSNDVIGAMNTAGMELPSVISHTHSGLPIDRPLSEENFPVVSLFARKLDERMVNRVKFVSTVSVPKASKSAIDIWVNCIDCGTKKRLEDVNRLVGDAREKNNTVDRVGVIICPACAVIVKEH